MTIHYTVNSGGTSVIVPASARHVEYVEIVGDDTFRELVIDASQRSKPGTVEVCLTLPAIAGISVSVLDASRGGGLRLTTEDGLALTTEAGDTLTTEGSPTGVSQFITDGIQLSAYLRATTDCSAQVTPLLRVYPAL